MWENRRLRAALMPALLSIVVFVIGLFGPDAHAADFWVGTEPGDYTTIQAAVDAAGPADRVIVRTGTYAEDVVIDKPIELLPDLGAHVVLDGNITFAAEAGGTMVGAFEMTEGKTVFIEDGIDWSPMVSPSNPNWVATVLARTGTSQHVVFGDIISRQDFGEYGGMWVQANGEGTVVTHTGTLDVGSSDTASSVRGIALITGDMAQMSLGATRSTAGRIAIGTHVFTGNMSDLTVSGEIVATAQSDDSVATGLGIRGETRVTAEVQEIVAEAGRLAIGFDFNTFDDAVLIHTGRVEATARDAGSTAYGIELGAGDHSRFTIGDVSAEAGELARGITTMYDPGAIINTDGLAADVSVNVGSVVAVARDANSQSYGIDLDAEDDFSLTAGDVEVRADQIARAVWLRLGDGGSVALTGDVTAVSGSGSAQGLYVQAGGGFSAAVANIDVEGAQAAVQGVFLNIGDDGALSHSGLVRVTGTSDLATVRGFNLVTAQGFSASINDIVVEASTEAAGLIWQVLDHGKLFHTGTVTAITTAAGGRAGGASIVAGDGLTVEADTFEAISRGNTGSATGVFVSAQNDLDAGFRSLSATGPSAATALVVHAQDGATVQAKGVTAASTDVSATAYGVVMHAGTSANLALGTVDARGQGTDSEAFAVTGSIGDDLTAVLGDITAVAGLDGRGISLETGARANIRADRVEAVGRSGGSEARGVFLQAADALTVSVGEVAAQAGATAWGVLTQANQDLTVDVGSVSAEAGRIAYGILVDGITSAVTVNGAIETRATEIARGLLITEGQATVTNYGRVFAAADEAVAIQFGSAASGESLAVHNLGAVEVSGRNGAALALRVAGEATVVNEGVIRAGDGSSIAVEAALSSGSITLHNFGTITGSVLLGQAKDVLTVSETGVIDGTVDLGPGDDAATIHYQAILAGILDGGAGDDHLTLLGPAANTMPEGSIPTRLLPRSFEEAWVHGGAWFLAGTTDVGVMEVRDAFLRIDEAVTITALVLQDGVLTGMGNVTGDVTNTGGVLSPGSSYGVLTITGSYTQRPDGALHIELDLSQPPVPGVTYDQLVIVGGTAVFEDGTTVRVVPAVGSRLPNRAEFVIVDGDVIFDPGQVRLELIMPSRLFYEGWLEEGSMKLILAVAPFDTIAETPNQKEISDALTDAKDDPAADLDDLLDWLVGLDPDEADKARDAYDSLSGEVYSHLPTLASERWDLVADAVVRGLSRPGGGAGKGVWAIPYSKTGRVRAGTGTAESKFRLDGIAAGVDLVKAESARLGLSLGGGRERLTMEARASEIEGQGFHAGVYGAIGLSGARLTTLLGYNSTAYEVRRDVVFGDVRRRAVGQLSSTDWGAVVDARFALANMETVRMEPFASVGYFRAKRPVVTEDGAGTFGLIVDGQKMSRWRWRVGVDLAGETYPLGSTTVRPQLRLAWVRDVPGLKRVMTGRLQGAADYPFTIYGTQPVSTGYEASIGLEGDIGPSTSWSIQYSGFFRMDMRSHWVTGRIEYRF